MGVRERGKDVGVRGRVEGMWVLGGEGKDVGVRERGKDVGVRGRGEGCGYEGREQMKV